MSQTIRPELVQSVLNSAFRQAEELGGWADYAVYCLGDSITGIEEFDNAVAELYQANENMHRVANKLALRYDVDLFQGA